MRSTQLHSRPRRARPVRHQPAYCSLGMLGDSRFASVLLYLNRLRGLYAVDVAPSCGVGSGTGASGKDPTTCTFIPDFADARSGLHVRNQKVRGTMRRKLLVAAVAAALLASPAAAQEKVKLR